MTEPGASDESDLCCPLEDDPRIADDAVLYRRLPAYNLKPTTDAPRPRRITSNAFQDPDPWGVSFYSADLLASKDLTWRDVIPLNKPDWGVASFTAGAARKQGFGVRLRPDPADPHNPLNYAHGELTGLRKGKSGQKQAKPLAGPPTVLLELPN